MRAPRPRKTFFFPPSSRTVFFSRANCSFSLQAIGVARRGRTDITPPSLIHRVSETPVGLPSLNPLKGPEANGDVLSHLLFEALPQLVPSCEKQKGYVESLLLCAPP